MKTTIKKLEEDIQTLERIIRVAGAYSLAFLCGILLLIADTHSDIKTLEKNLAHTQHDLSKAEHRIFKLINFISDEASVEELCENAAKILNKESFDVDLSGSLDIHCHIRSKGELGQGKAYSIEELHEVLTYHSKVETIKAKECK